MLPLKSTALLSVGKESPRAGFLWTWLRKRVGYLLLNRQAKRHYFRKGEVNTSIIFPLRLFLCCGFVVAIVFQLNKPLFHQIKEQCRLWSNQSLLFCEQLHLMLPQRCEAQTAMKVMSGLLDLIQAMLHRLELSAGRAVEDLCGKLWNIMKTSFGWRWGILQLWPRCVT